DEASADRVDDTHEHNRQGASRLQQRGHAAATPPSSVRQRARPCRRGDRMKRAGDRMAILKLPHRRQFLQLVAGAAALPAVSHIARAQSYPSPPVRIVVPYAPGGSTDTVARITADRLSRIWGQQVVIENKPGGGTNIAAAAVAGSDPDGY